MDNFTVELHFTAAAQDAVEQITVHADQWASMNPPQRLAYLEQKAAQLHDNSCGGYGWHLPPDRETDLPTNPAEPNVRALLAQAITNLETIAAHLKHSHVNDMLHQALILIGRASTDIRDLSEPARPQTAKQPSRRRKTPGVSAAAVSRQLREGNINVQYRESTGVGGIKCRQEGDDVRVSFLDLDHHDQDVSAIVADANAILTACGYATTVRQTNEPGYASILVSTPAPAPPTHTEP